MNGFENLEDQPTSTPQKGKPNLENPNSSISNTQGSSSRVRLRASNCRVNSYTFVGVQLKRDFRWTNEFLLDLREVSLEKFCEKWEKFLCQQAPRHLTQLLDSIYRRKEGLVPEHEINALKIYLDEEGRKNIPRCSLSFQETLFDLCKIPEPTQEQRNLAERLKTEDRESIARITGSQKRTADLREKIAIQRAKNAGLDRIQSRVDVQIATYRKMNDHIMTEIAGMTVQHQKRKFDTIIYASEQQRHLLEQRKKLKVNFESS